MSFQIALTGLNAATADLTTTANNIANNATTGYKASRTEFAELFAVSPGGMAGTATGNGVRVSAVAQQFTQGSINFTQNGMDLAVSGAGFFTVGSGGGSLSYTRAGAFRTDANGYVVNAQQQRLQVFPPVATGGFDTGSMTDLKVIAAESPPKATGAVNFVLNLPANATPPATATFDPADPTSYTNATSLTVFDSLGAAHTATTYYSRTATAGVWDARLYVDGTAVGTAQQLTFDTTGVLTAPTTGQLPFGPYTPATGASPMNITVDYSKATQYDGTFGVNSVLQDGYTTGLLTGMNIDKSGVVMAQYTNGHSTALGKVVLSNFTNPNGLQQVSDTEWTETSQSGQALHGEAGSAGFGLLQSGALEASNVDITAQLVNMISAQRNFQANAQMISTTDQITQTIINIR